MAVAQQTKSDSSGGKLSFVLDTEIIRRNETKMTNSVPPETDIRVAVNPTDGNNLIHCSIQHRLNNSTDAYVMPIYYTKDNGRQWNRSLFRLLPKDDYRVLLEANSPSIGFTNDGTAILSWAVTYIAQRLPGLDSLYHQVLCASSVDGGESWEETDFPFLESTRSLRSIGKTNYGRLNQYESIQVINDKIRNRNYLFLLNRSTNDSTESEFYLYDIDNNYEKIYTNTSLINNFLDFTKFDAKISIDGNLNLIFLSFLSGLNISYANIDFEREKLTNLFDISEVSYTGGFYFPGSFLNSEVGLNGRYFAPTPKFIDLNNQKIIIWNASGIANQEFNHKIYISKFNEDGFIEETRKISNSITGFEFNPDIIKTDNDRIYVSFYDRNYSLDSSSTNVKVIYSDNLGESFEEAFQANYVESDHSFAGNRNFNYGVGINHGLIANNSHIFQFWTDTRSNDGNIDLYSTQLPLLDNINQFVNNDLNEIEINDFSSDLSNYKVEINAQYQIDADIYITNYTGKIIRINSIDKLISGVNTINFNMSRYASGVYFLIIESNNTYLFRQFYFLN